jgi:hypothetical protein
LRTSQKEETISPSLTAAGISIGGFFIMPEAVKLIVEGYLSLKDRGALEELRVHRQRLRKQLHDRSSSGLAVVGRTTQLLDDELIVIEAAIHRLAG